MGEGCRHDDPVTETLSASSRSPPRGSGARKLGEIQIDSVNVVTQTHYLPGFSRLGDYPREALEAAEGSGIGGLLRIWCQPTPGSLASYRGHLPDP